ncbi:MAG: hypothetical protein NUV51_10000 [Sulfuricaulis sp.]|nr:hypothetical protein [Sulfuricaulis sp.]
MSQHTEAIREALKAGPTRGEWRASGGFNEWTVSSDHSVAGKPCISGRQYVASCFRVSKKDTPEYAAMFKANAEYIAACNPVNVAALLAERDALLEALQHMQWCSACAEGLWGDCDEGRTALAAIAKAQA